MFRLIFIARSVNCVPHASVGAICLKNKIEINSESILLIENREKSIFINLEI